MQTLRFLATCAFAATAAATGPADADAPSGTASYAIEPGPEQTVAFRSKAPLESFEGSTHEISGHVSLDPASIGEVIDLEVRVDLASLDTGLAMRNRHMRENHLHTDRFPYAIFRGGAVAAGRDTDLRDGEAHEITVTGELDLHGVKREMSVPLMLRLDPENVEPEGGLRVTSGFPVALADHDIPRPRFLFAKLGEVQRVFVDIVARVPADREAHADDEIPSGASVTGVTEHAP